MPQHEDPFIFNAITGNWQNATNPATSGAPFGLTIGPTSASWIRLTPMQGDTISIDGGTPATVESALQMSSGGASELVNAYVASIVLNAGAANEQIGTVITTAISSTTARAIVMLARTADNSLAGSTRFGDIVAGAGPPTWAFTSVLRLNPGVSTMQLAYDLVAYAPGTSNSESWHAFNPLSGSWSVPSNGYANYRLTPMNELQISAWILAPATSQNGVTIATFPSAYRPVSKHGISCATDGISSTGAGNGFFTITNGGVLQSTGIAASSNCYIEEKIPLDV